MNHTIKLLDKYREVCSITSDNQAAIRLGISRGTISAWRHERNHAEPESVEAMAKAVGFDVEEWVLRVQADREGQLNPKRAQVWLRCAQRISGTAAGIALTLGLAVYTPKSEALSAPASSATITAPVYIMRILGWFTRRLRRIVGPPHEAMRAPLIPA